MLKHLINLKRGTLDKVERGIYTERIYFDEEKNN